MTHFPMVEFFLSGFKYLSVKEMNLLISKHLVYRVYSIFAKGDLFSYIKPSYY